MSDLTLRKLRNSENFFNLYMKLVAKTPMSRIEKETILRIAILLINDENEILQRLGYRIVLFYSNKTDDYRPLYDIAINSGYAPISKIIEDIKFVSPEYDDGDESFFSLFNSSLLEFYKVDNQYMTFSQQELMREFAKNANRTMAVVAPTSYGKSELFSSFCRQNRHHNICMIVPTKALLAQTKQRLLHALDAEDNRRIITHPDMYVDNGEPFIAVLTQERLLRLFQDDDQLSFRYVFIDEAHNLLENEQRSILLAQAIILLNGRNEEVAYKFLSPFLVDTNNLTTKYTDKEIWPHIVEERLKSERFYLIDFREGNGAAQPLRFYDHFLDKYSNVEGETFRNRFEFLGRLSASKNIVYLNSPPKIERFVSQLIEHRDNIVNREIQAVCDELAHFIHQDFMLIRCLRKGLVYHHGSLPDIVKLYVEHIFSAVTDISHIVTSSTLLEGVNIPAEKLFLFEVKKGSKNLSASQFQNLVGRICRFSEIFNADNGSPKKLESCIYVVGGHECGVRANLENFLKNSTKIDKEVKDKIENVLLENTELTNEDNWESKLEADQTLENIAPGITGENANYASTPIGRLCYVNNITEIDILRSENEMYQRIGEVQEHAITTVQELLRLIANVFVDHLKEGVEPNLERLQYTPTQNFYAMYLTWRMQNTSYSEMISNVLQHWERVEDPIVYVHKWGDMARDEDGFRSWYVNIRDKSKSERVNLAVVRVKEEQDFVDNYLIKFVEVLNDLNLLNEEMYLRIKYGTNDRYKIALINSGINNHLANVLLDNYAAFLEVNVEAKSVSIDAGVIEQMEANEENSILVFETKFHVRG